MPTDGAVFKAFVEKSRVRPIRIYESMDISKQAFYKLYNSKEFEPDTIKKIEKATGATWDKIKETNVDVNVSRETDVKTVDSSNKALSDLIENNRMLAEAMLIDAKNRLNLTESNKELVSMVKDLLTEGDPLESQEAVDAIRFAFLELISQVGTGKRWKSSDEVKTIYRKLVSGALAPKSEEGIQKNLDKHRI